MITTLSIARLLAASFVCGGLVACGGGDASGDVQASVASVAVFEHPRSADAYTLTEDQVGSLDALEYIATWPDLRAAFGVNWQQGANHLASYGIIERRTSATQFDAEQYLDSSANAQAACVNASDPLNCAAQYFINVGFWQGEAWSDLHALLYTASYPELRSAFGIDVEAAKNHWVTWGRDGGMSIQFNVISWLQTMPDLMSRLDNTFEAAVRYYIRNGSTNWTDQQRFKLFSNNFCLGVLNGSMSAGNFVVTSSCNGSINQQWMVQSDRKIRSAANPSLCMQPSAQPDLGVRIIVGSCNNELAAQWFAGSMMGVMTKDTQLCMDTGDGALAAGKGIYLQVCDMTYRSQWWYPRI